MRSAICLGLLVAGCGSTEKIAALAPGELIGQVQISADVPASSCQVLLEGTPLAGPCDENGEFDIRHVPPGRWNLRVITDGAATALPVKRLAAAANSGQVSDLGAVVLAKPGSVGGHLINVGGADLSLSIVAVPDDGDVTAPNPNNGFLLSAVAPGAHQIVLITDAGTVVNKNVLVQPGKVTIGADLDLAMLQTNEVAVVGHAGRAGRPADQFGNLTVELVESLNGTVVDHATTTSDGAFQLKAKPGTYIVRAHDASNPVTAIIPSLVVSGTSDVSLASTLTIHDAHGDLDGDGISNDKDDDIDGDGVLNAADAFPYDPAEWLDTDGDGVGDRADLRSKGGTGIDTQTPTPDSDGDGKLDFEDNCPTVANADQKDSDGDGFGDVCDNCPFTANADQLDSAGNGTGDACRACKQNADCPGGKFCNFGQCVGCISNLTCGDLVCDAVKAVCVPCAKNSECTAPDLCDPSGRCVACLMTSDCAAGLACVSGQCLPQCTNDAACPGGFCVGGACVTCRGTADCPSSEWCDAGQCKSQCTTDADCTGGRSCDQPTRTCVLPCMMTCPSGQSCVGNACRFACDQTHLCDSGFKCSAGACVPECAVDGDCAAVRPFTICQAGACVPDGGCSFDSGCPADKQCISSVCSARPGTLTAGKGFSCTSACDCKQGETCSVNSSDQMKYCVNDRAPTWFVSKAAGCSGACDGSSPQAWSVSLAAVMAKSKTGDVIAVRAGDGFAGTQTLTHAGMALLGGFTVCAPNRWVRDVTQRSALTAATDVILIPGTVPSPLPDITVAGFDLTQTAAPPNSTEYHAVGASQSDNLTLSNLTASMTLPAPGDGASASAVVGFAVATGKNVTMSDVSMFGLSACGGCIATGARLAGASGLLERVHVGGFISGNGRGIDVTNTVGAVTIDAAQTDGGTVGHGDFGIQVLNGSGGTVTLSNNEVSWVQAALPASGAETWHGISLINCPTVVSTGNTVDGRGVVEPASVGGWTQRESYYLSNSDGTLTNDTVYFPSTTNIVNVYGWRVVGPDGHFTFTNNHSSLGDQSNANIIVSLEDITNGPLVFNQCGFAAGTSLGNSWGFSVTNTSAAVLLTDTSVKPASNGGGNTSFAFAITNGVARFERSKILGSAHSASLGIDASSASLELYDSYVTAGGNSGSLADAIRLGGTTQLNATNSTIDGGGAVSGGGFSAGIQAAGSCVLFMTNNLISGGNVSGAHYRLNASSGTPFVAANWHNNYLWYAAPGGDTAGDSASSVATNGASADGNGNLMVGNASCYDPLLTQPDYHIAATSPCVNAGTAALRKDGTTLANDIDGNARVQGAAVDIGAHEAK